MDLHRLRVVEFDTLVSEEEGEKKSIAELVESKQEECKVIRSDNKKGKTNELKSDKNYVDDNINSSESSKKTSFVNRKSKSEIFRIPSKNKLKKRELKINSSFEDLSTPVNDSAHSNAKKITLNLFTRKSAGDQKRGDIKSNKEGRKKKEDIHFLFARETPSFIRYSRKRARNEGTRDNHDFKLPYDIFGFHKNNRSVHPHLYQMSCNYLNLDKFPFKNIKKGFRRNETPPVPLKDCFCKHHAMRVLNSRNETSVDDCETRSMYYNLSAHSHPPKARRRHDQLRHEEGWRKKSSYYMAKDETVSVTPSSLVPIKKCCCDACVGPSKSGLASHSQRRPPTHRDPSSSHHKPSCHCHHKPGPSQHSTPGPQQHTTPGPQQNSTPDPQQHSTPGPQQHSTTGPQQHSTSGPQQYSTPGPQQHSTTGPQQHSTSGPQQHSTPSPSRTSNVPAQNKPHVAPCNKKKPGCISNKQRNRLFAGLLQNVTTFHSKNWPTGKKIIKYGLFGLLVVVWSPCLLAVILAWVIMCPVKLTNILANDKNKNPIPLLKSFMNRFCKKGPGSEYQRMRCGKYSCQKNKSFMTSVVSWYARAAGTVVNSFRAMVSMLKVSNNAPTCCGAGSSFLTSSHPNPKRRYTLFYTDNRGWMMKPARRGHMQSCASTRVVQSMRCEFRPKFWQKSTHGQKYSQTKMGKSSRNVNYGHPDVKSNTTRQRLSPAGDATCPCPGMISYSGNRFSPSRLKIARRNRTDSAMLMPVPSHRLSRQQVNISPKNILETSGIASNSSKYPRVKIKPKTFNSSQIAENSQKYYSKYHLTQRKNGTLPYGIIFDCSCGTKHPLITNREIYRNHNFGLAGKTLNMTTKYTPRYKQKGVQGQFTKYGPLGCVCPKHGPNTTKRKSPGTNRTGLTDKTKSLRTKNTPSHESNGSQGQSIKYRIALNCPCGTKHKPSIPDRKLHRTLKSDYTDKTRKQITTDRETLRTRNKTTLANLSKSALIKHAGTSTYKIDLTDKITSIDALGSSAANVECPCKCKLSTKKDLLKKSSSPKKSAIVCGCDTEKQPASNIETVRPEQPVSDKSAIDCGCGTEKHPSITAAKRPANKKTNNLKKKSPRTEKASQCACYESDTTHAKTVRAKKSASDKKLIECGCGTESITAAASPTTNQENIARKQVPSVQQATECACKSEQKETIDRSSGTEMQSSTAVAKTPSKQQADRGIEKASQYEQSATRKDTMLSKQSVSNKNKIGTNTIGTKSVEYGIALNCPCASKKLLKQQSSTVFKDRVHSLANETVSNTSIKFSQELKISDEQSYKSRIALNCPCGKKHKATDPLKHPPPSIDRQTSTIEAALPSTLEKTVVEKKVPSVQRVSKSEQKKSIECGCGTETQPSTAAAKKPSKKQVDKLKKQSLRIEKASQCACYNEPSKANIETKQPKPTSNKKAVECGCETETQPNTVAAAQNSKDQENTTKKTQNKAVHTKQSASVEKTIVCGCGTEKQSASVEKAIVCGCGTESQSVAVRYTDPSALKELTTAGKEPLHKTGLTDKPKHHLSQQAIGPHAQPASTLDRKILPSNRSVYADIPQPELSKQVRSQQSTSIGIASDCVCEKNQYIAVDNKSLYTRKTSFAEHGTNPSQGPKFSQAQSQTSQQFPTPVFGIASDCTCKIYKSAYPPDQKMKHSKEQSQSLGIASDCACEAFQPITIEKKSSYTDKSGLTEYPISHQIKSTQKQPPTIGIAADCACQTDDLFATDKSTSLTGQPPRHLVKPSQPHTHTSQTHTHSSQTQKPSQPHTHTSQPHTHTSQTQKPSQPHTHTSQTKKRSQPHTHTSHTQKPSQPHTHTSQTQAPSFAIASDCACPTYDSIATDETSTTDITSLADQQLSKQTKFSQTPSTQKKSRIIAGRRKTDLGKHTSRRHTKPKSSQTSQKRSSIKIGPEMYKKKHYTRQTSSKERSRSQTVKASQTKYHSSHQATQYEQNIKSCKKRAIDCINRTKKHLIMSRQSPSCKYHSGQVKSPHKHSHKKCSDLSKTNMKSHQHTRKPRLAERPPSPKIYAPKNRIRSLERTSKCCTGYKSKIKQSSSFKTPHDCTCSSIRPSKAVLFRPATVPKPPKGSSSQNSSCRRMQCTCSVKLIQFPSVKTSYYALADKSSSQLIPTVPKSSSQNSSCNPMDCTCSVKLIQFPPVETSHRAPADKSCSRLLGHNIKKQPQVSKLQSLQRHPLSISNGCCCSHEAKSPYSAKIDKSDNKDSSAAQQSSIRSLDTTECLSSVNPPSSSQLPPSNISRNSSKVSRLVMKLHSKLFSRKICKQTNIPAQSPIPMYSSPSKSLCDNTSSHLESIQEDQESHHSPSRRSISQPVNSSHSKCSCLINKPSSARLTPQKTSTSIRSRKSTLIDKSYQSLSRRSQISNKSQRPTFRKYSNDSMCHNKCFCTHHKTSSKFSLDKNSPYIRKPIQVDKSYSRSSKRSISRQSKTSQRSSLPSYSSPMECLCMVNDTSQHSSKTSRYSCKSMVDKFYSGLSQLSLSQQSKPSHLSSIVMAMTPIKCTCSSNETSSSPNDEKLDHLGKKSQLKPNQRNKMSQFSSLFRRSKPKHSAQKFSNNSQPTPSVDKQRLISDPVSHLPRKTTIGSNAPPAHSQHQPNQHQDISKYSHHLSSEPAPFVAERRFISDPGSQGPHKTTTGTDALAGFPHHFSSQQPEISKYSRHFSSQQTPLPKKQRRTSNQHPHHPHKTTIGTDALAGFPHHFSSQQPEISKYSRDFSSQPLAEKQRHTADLHHPRQTTEGTEELPILKQLHPSQQPEISKYSRHFSSQLTPSAENQQILSDPIVHHPRKIPMGTEEQSGSSQNVPRQEPQISKRSSLLQRSQSKPLAEKLRVLSDKISLHSRKNGQEKKSSSQYVQTAPTIPCKCTCLSEKLHKLSERISQYSHRPISEKKSPPGLSAHVDSLQPKPSTEKQRLESDPVSYLPRKTTIGPEGLPAHSQHPPSQQHDISNYSPQPTPTVAERRFILDTGSQDPRKITLETDALAGFPHHLSQQPENSKYSRHFSSQTTPSSEKQRLTSDPHLHHPRKTTIGTEGPPAPSQHHPSQHPDVSKRSSRDRHSQPKRFTEKLRKLSDIMSEQPPQPEQETIYYHQKLMQYNPSLPHEISKHTYPLDPFRPIIPIIPGSCTCGAKRRHQLEHTRKTALDNKSQQNIDLKHIPNDQHDTPHLHSNQPSSSAEKLRLLSDSVSQHPRKTTSGNEAVPGLPYHLQSQDPEISKSSHHISYQPTASAEKLRLLSDSVPQHPRKTMLGNGPVPGLLYHLPNQDPEISKSSYDISSQPTASAEKLRLLSDSVPQHPRKTTLGNEALPGFPHHHSSEHPENSEYSHHQLTPLAEKEHVDLDSVWHFPRKTAKGTERPPAYSQHLSSQHREISEYSPQLHSSQRTPSVDKQQLLSEPVSHLPHKTTMESERQPEFPQHLPSQHHDISKRSLLSHRSQSKRVTEKLQNRSDSLLDMSQQIPKSEQEKLSHKELSPHYPSHEASKHPHPLQTIPIIPGKCTCTEKQRHESDISRKTTLDKKSHQHIDLQDIPGHQPDTLENSHHLHNLQLIASANKQRRLSDAVTQHPHKSTVGTEEQSEVLQHLAHQQPESSKYTVHLSFQSTSSAKEQQLPSDPVSHHPRKTMIGTKALAKFPDRLPSLEPKICKHSRHYSSIDEQGLPSDPASHMPLKTTLRTEGQSRFSQHFQRSEVGHTSPPLHNSQPTRIISDACTCSISKYRIPQEIVLCNLQNASSECKSSEMSNCPPSSHHFQQSHSIISDMCTCFTNKNHSPDKVSDYSYKKGQVKKLLGLSQHITVQRSEIEPPHSKIMSAVFSPHACACTNNQLQAFKKKLSHVSRVQPVTATVDKPPPGLLQRLSSGQVRKGSADKGQQQLPQPAKPPNQSPYPDFNRVSMRYPGRISEPKRSEQIPGPIQSEPIPARKRSEHIPAPANYYYPPAVGVSPPPNYARFPCFINPANKCGPKTCYDESALRRAYKRRPLRYIPPKQQLIPRKSQKPKQKKKEKKAEVKKKKKKRQKKKQSGSKLAQCCRCVRDLVYEAEKEAWPAGVTCSPMYIHALKRRPCFWIFERCPSMYPAFLNCFKFQENICQMCKYLLAICFWCPLILCVYFCCDVICGSGK